jgi:uncharacterized repeat protein (TIGR01451 family)
VAKDGTGTGTVTSDPAGIDCGTTCSALFAEGSQVTLTVTPDADSTFTGWTGDCTGTDPCQLTMDADHSVSATFDLAPVTHTLTVAKDGTGTGTVTSDPAGIDCGTTCSAEFAEGSLVTLTATPDADSSFTGWSGDCTGTGPCQLTMGADHSATATFGLVVVDRSLTVAKDGTGTGTVTSDPAGIDCGTTCSALFAEGSQVTLTATPDADSTFTGWTGDCTGTDPCQLTMGVDHSVGATFGAISTTQADLRLSLDAPNKVKTGQRLTYTITVKNLGPDTATGVIVTDQLPSGVAFVSAVSLRGTCDQAGGTVSCDLGSLANRKRAVVSIVVTPTTVGSITNTAEVSANELDPNLANNTDVATTRVR